MKKVRFGNTSPLGSAKAPGGEPHATANKAPALIVQPTNPADESKPGSVKEWPQNRSYDHRPTARNKEPASRVTPTYDGLFDMFVG